jgi:type IV pilus assembly protein PilX
MSTARHITHRGALGGRGVRSVRDAQRGLSLITTLLFMVSALMLGVSVLSVNVMQERVIGNTKDRDLAFQAAEAALRDAERDLTLNITADSPFSPACTNGLCTPPSQRAVPLSVSVDDPATGFSWANAAQVRTYGQYTQAGNFPSGQADAEPRYVNAQPRYVIEKLGPLGTPPGESLTKGIEPTAPAYGYRITAQATGARAETVVVLQSIYTKR